MTEKTHAIRQAYHDVLIYDEGPDRVLELTCPSLVDPPQVEVPAPDDWADTVPAWARDRRELILERLRRAGAIIHERRDGAIAFPSPPKRAGGLPGRVFWLLANGMLIAGGLWQAWAGETPADHLIGLIGAGFFGLCALVPLGLVRRQPRRRRHSP